MTDQTITLEMQIDEAVKPPRIPRATYRLQFSPHFSFADAEALVDYLNDLGISELYSSPLFKPRSNSAHGYDIVDYNQFNERIGGAEGFEALVDTLKQYNIGLLLDVVPNHMGVNTENAWWMDVLKHGPSSPYAPYFDIDWRPVNRALDDKVLLPILGDHFGRVLEAGQLELVYWHGDFYVHYYEHQFPITPEAYDVILQAVYDELVQEPHEEWVEMELASVITALEHMPAYNTKDEDQLTVRRREQVILRWRLLGLFDKSEEFRNALDKAMKTFNGDPDEPASYDALDALLYRQPYRLSYWRVASDEINYRRFFDINDMAAIRIEEPHVFSDTHRLTLRLLAEGKVSGLRIDHPDGLWNPQTYFMQLQQEYAIARLRNNLEDADNYRGRVEERLATLAALQVQPAPWPLYVLVEKILTETEPLPPTWAVYGTTGYDFMNVANQLFVDSSNQVDFDTLYADFTEQIISFYDLTDATKKLVMNQSLTSEIDARSAQLARIVEKNRLYRGFTRNSLAFAMSKIIAGLPIYRTYITGPGTISERDRFYIEQAVQLAKERNPLMPGSLFEFLGETLLLDNLQDFDEEQRADLREFVMKFQQITGPVMAKSVEDTAFYVYNRLVSLNEVGGHPEHFGISVEDFHQHHVEKGLPYSMLSTSTHDTKRSEDIRARINVLSEMPTAWQQAIYHWSVINTSARTLIDEESAPARNDEYLLYQTLIGAFPNEYDDLSDFKERIIGYMHKAINEAKQHSNWLNPNTDYAESITRFVNHTLDDETFMQAFMPFQRRVSFFGRFNSLSQVLLKLTVPGIPDIYQGNEMWNFSLVDPDNRRPVDFDKRRALLADLKARAEADAGALARELVDDAESGAIKMYLTYRALHFRRDNEELFQTGTYVPLIVTGEKAQHVCAFLRQGEDTTALVIVPRLVVGLTKGEEIAPVGAEVWGDTALDIPDDLTTFTNVYTGAELAVTDGQVKLAEALATFPVGLFVT